MLLAAVLTLAVVFPAVASAHEGEKHVRKSGSSGSFSVPDGGGPAPSSIPDYALEENGDVVMGGDVVTDCRSFAKGFGRDGDLKSEDQARRVLDQCKQAGLLSSGSTAQSGSVSASVSASSESKGLPQTGGLALTVLPLVLLIASALMLRGATG